MDMIAQDLGIDPVEMRLKNAVGPNHTTANDMKVTSCGLEECIVKAAEAVNWKEKWGKKRQVGKIARGIGFAATTYLSGVRLSPHPGCAAFIRVAPDGSIHLITGATDAGQGSDTVLSQIAAEELGVALEDIDTGLVDTDFTPIDIGTLSSRVTVGAGAAVKAAAEDARRQLAEFASETLKADPQEIVFRDRRVFVEGNPARGLDLHRLARAAHATGREILGRGSGDLNSAIQDLGTMTHGKGNHSPAYAFCAQAVEVEVDTETGQVRVVDTTVGSDSGVVLNPLVVEGQVDGCIYMGLGQTLTEELIYDEQGKLLTPNFSDYKLPRSIDMPQMHLIPVETFEPNTPYGAKEGSEAPQVTTYPAIVSAVYDAIGVWIRDLPITPGKVLQALKEKEKQK
jgi:4-hydroxybenzoyl-CoA reductase subunit alpha